MKTNYSKTNWVNNSTPVNADNLNNIENGIYNLYSNALSLSDLMNGDGIEINGTEDGVSIGLKFRKVDTKPESSTASGNVGDFYMDEEFIFFCIFPNKWIKLNIVNF